MGPADRPPAPPLQLPLFGEPHGRLPAPPLPSTFEHPQAQREICLEDVRVAYRLRRARRRSIGFVVGVDGLTVSAPRWVGAAEIDAALREKSAWIVRKLHEQHDRARRIAATRIAWRDGAAFPFLGETVILVLDPRASGAVLRDAPDPLPGGARLAPQLAAAPGATLVRGALRPLRGATRGARDEARAEFGVDALGQRERRRLGAAALAAGSLRVAGDRLRRRARTRAPARDASRQRVLGPGAVGAARLRARARRAACPAAARIRSLSMV